jgi:hypothetical protein
MRKYLITAAILTAFVTPAAAAAMAATTWYVAMDAKSKKCSVTSKKPDGTKMTMVGTDTYKTKADATKAEKADTKDCAPATKM